jgi:hypothetical protein
MSELVAYAGWALVPAFAALWWGERCRRVDAQKREERIPVIAPPAAAPAKVRMAQAATPESADLEEGRESYIDACMREGYSRPEAEADWAMMMEREHSDARVG